MNSSFVKKVCLLLAAVSTAAVISGCGGSNESGNTASSKPVSSSTAAASEVKENGAVQTEEGYWQLGDWVYQVLSGKKILIRKYIGHDSAIEIPAEFEGLPVVEIDHGLFKDVDSSSIVSVVIPEGVKNIDECVFENCTSLTSISFPSTLDMIRQYAFKGCTALEEVSFENCPKFDFIGIGAFRGCTSLKTITFSHGTGFEMTNIGSGCFKLCPKLRDVYMPDEVLSIGNYLTGSDVDEDPKNSDVMFHVSKGSSVERYMKDNDMKYVFYTD